MVQESIDGTTLSSFFEKLHIKLFLLACDKTKVDITFPQIQNKGWIKVICVTPTTETLANSAQS